MKTPEEWEVILEERQSFTCLDFVEIIRMIQTEAYNQAIRDAVQNAKANLYTEQGVGAYTEVDKESILKLLKK